MKLGRSTKNISSNLPFLNSSGGKLETSFAVATTKTGDFLSCIQVSQDPNTLDVVPPSDTPLLFDPDIPLSISSHQRIQGATLSATLNTCHIFCSEDPTNPEKTLPISNLSNGKFQNDEIDLANKDLPAPCIPTNNIPLGLAGNP